MGDQISRDADLGIRQAIDVCLPEPDDTEETASDDSTTAEAADQTAVDADGATDGSATHTFSAVLDYSEGDGQVYYEWSGAFQVADDGGISGSGTVVGRTEGTCEVSGIGGTSAEYATYGEGRFDLVGQTAGDGLEISFASVTGQLTKLEGDGDQLCVDISFDAARALLWSPLGDEAFGGPIVVPAAGGSVSIEPPEWGIAIELRSSGSESGLSRRRGEDYVPRQAPGTEASSRGYLFLHSALDDRTRIVYSEIHNDEQAVTAVEFWN